MCEYVTVPVWLKLTTDQLLRVELTVYLLVLFFNSQIAVDNGFGGLYGQQKADWMVDVVQQYFHDNGWYLW